MSSPLAAVDRFPRVRLGHAPTPLDPAPRLGAALGIELWIKRDDCTGLAFGGNKVRQLEFHLGEAQARGADTVLVTGAVQSTSSASPRPGLAGSGWTSTPSSKSASPTALATALPATCCSAGCSARRCMPLGEDEAAADAALERRARVLADRGRRPYVIHSAPGHPPLGGLGYVLAAEEVTAQARALGVGFDAVVCASGSALTHAGVLVGLRALGEAAPVYGICVRRDARRQGDRVAKVAAELAGLIERPAAFDAGGVEVSDTVHAPGYGRLNDAVCEAMAMAARHEALLLDPVYTGKAMAGLVAHVRAGRIAAGSRVLFLHTGGLPALFAYADKLGSWLTKAPWATPR